MLFLSFRESKPVFVILFILFFRKETSLCYSYYYSIFAESDPVYVIFSNRHELRRVDMATTNAISLISGLRNTIALDFYYKGGQPVLFWTDVMEDKIYSGKMVGNGTYSYWLKKLTDLFCIHPRSIFKCNDLLQKEIGVIPLTQF